MKTWEHDPCYNPKEKLPRGSEHESVAVERPTNTIECIADGQKIDLLREVSDEEEKDLRNRPDGSHEPQDEPQELEGLLESQDSKWQVAEANAKAEGTSGRAEVIGKAAVVKGKALSGRVDEADETPDGHQPKAKQANSYCKESQRNENTKRNIPSAHGVPLEGEWPVCASGRVRDSRNSASMSNAAVEHADSSSEPAELVGVDREKSDSCEDGMGKRGWIDEWSWQVEMPRLIVRIPKGCCQLGRADSSAICKEASVDGQGKSTKLVPTTVELDDPGGGEKPRVCLGGTKTQI